MNWRRVATMVVRNEIMLQCMLITSNHFIIYNQQLDFIWYWCIWPFYRTGISSNFAQLSLFTQRIVIGCIIIWVAVTSRHTLYSINKKITDITRSISTRRFGAGDAKQTNYTRRKLDEHDNYWLDYTLSSTIYTARPSSAMHLCFANLTFHS